MPEKSKEEQTNAVWKVYKKIPLDTHKAETQIKLENVFLNGILLLYMKLLHFFLITVHAHHKGSQVEGRTNFFSKYWKISIHF